MASLSTAAATGGGGGPNYSNLVASKKPDGQIDSAEAFLAFAETPHIEPSALGDWAAFVAAATAGRTQVLDYLKGVGMSKLADRQKCGNASQKCVRAGSLVGGAVGIS